MLRSPIIGSVQHLVVPASWVNTFAPFHLADVLRLCLSWTLTPGRPHLKHDEKHFSCTCGQIQPMRENLALYPLIL